MAFCWSTFHSWYAPLTENKSTDLNRQIKHNPTYLMQVSLGLPCFTFRRMPGVILEIWPEVSLVPLFSIPHPPSLFNSFPMLLLCHHVNTLVWPIIKKKLLRFGDNYNNLFKTKPLQFPFVDTRKILESINEWVISFRCWELDVAVLLLLGSQRVMRQTSKVSVKQRHQRMPRRNVCVSFWRRRRQVTGN